MICAKSIFGFVLGASIALCSGSTTGNFPFVNIHHTKRNEPQNEWILPQSASPLLQYISTGFYNDFRLYPGGFGLGQPMTPTGEDTAPGSGEQTRLQQGTSVIPYQPIYVFLPSPFGMLPFFSGSPVSQQDPMSSPALTTRDNSCTFNSEIGVCYPQRECSAEGGRVTSYCRDFTKSCCIFNYNCGASSNKEVSHFRNAYYPLPESISYGCSMTFEKIDGSICYFRIKPIRLTLPASTGYCDNIYFHVNGVPGKNYKHLCGSLQNQEFDVDVQNTNSIALTINTDQKIRISWNIAVTQKPCSDPAGNMWPFEESGTDTGSRTKTTTTTQSPPNPADAVENPIPEPSGNEPVCGFLHKRSEGNVRHPGHSLSVDIFVPDTKSFVGQRRQLPVPREEEECENEGGPGCAAESKKDNSSIQSSVWNVPTVTDSLLYHFAGTPLQVGTRITYGEKTSPHEFPWAIAMRNRGKFHCGGSLISRQHVLTAAHCVVKYKRRPNTIDLIIGDWDIKSNTDGQNIIGQVKTISTHPGYSTITLKYDVAVLTLQAPVALSDTVMPICLPNYDIPLEGRLVTVTGWGRDERNMLQSVLMKHSAGVVVNSECDKRWVEQGAPPGIIVDEMLCMDPQDGDSCKGDSGGPSVLEDPPNSGRYVQVGIVSFGSASCTDKKLPGVYTKVSKVMDWIKEQMKVV